MQNLNPSALAGHAPGGAGPSSTLDPQAHPLLMRGHSHNDLYGLHPTGPLGGQPVYPSPYYYGKFFLGLNFRPKIHAKRQR